jgi:hypothetical protein
MKNSLLEYSKLSISFPLEIHRQGHKAGGRYLSRALTS